MALTRNRADMTDFAPGNPVDFGAKTDGSADATAAFNACLAEFGCVQYPYPATFRIDGTVVVGENQWMNLGAKTKLLRVSSASGNDPVLHIKGGEGDDFQGATVVGGIYESQRVHASGVVAMGHMSTTSNYNARRSHFSHFKIFGKQTLDTGNVGLFLPSGQPVNGDDASQYFQHISCGEILTCDVGIYLGPLSNGHHISDIVFRNIKSKGFRMNGAYGNYIAGGFMDTGVNGVIGISLENSTLGSPPHHSEFNIINGFRCEPGGLASQGVFIGSSCQYNQINMIANTGGGSTIGNTNNDINTGFQLTFRGGGYNGIGINSGGSFTNLQTHKIHYRNVYSTTGDIDEGATQEIFRIFITATRYCGWLKVVVNLENPAGQPNACTSREFFVTRQDGSASVTAHTPFNAGSSSISTSVTASDIVSFRLTAPSHSTSTTYTYVAQVETVARDPGAFAFVP